MVSAVKACDPWAEAPLSAVAAGPPLPDSRLLTWLSARPVQSLRVPFWFLFPARTAEGRLIPNDRAQRSHYFRVRHLAIGTATFAQHLFCARHPCVTHMRSLDLSAAVWKVLLSPPAEKAGSGPKVS